MTAFEKRNAEVLARIKASRAAPKQLTTIAFAPVRRDSDSGREWLDMSASSAIREQVDQHVSRDASGNSQWHAANPVVRIAEVVVTESATLLATVKAR